MAEEEYIEIPHRMQPYTIIQYISEKEHIILQGGESEPELYNENGLTEEEQRFQDEVDAMIAEQYPDLLVHYAEDEDLPPTAGMKVYYNSLGFIHKVVELGEEWE